MITAKLALFLLAVIWELIWKGFALWKAAVKGQKVWYFFILVLNTLGILPIVYLLMERAKENKGSFKGLLKVKSIKRSKKKGKRRR